jgi:U32 family peptidase
MIKNMINIPELLAPAGDADCAFAAFDNGADAIYAGLPKFSARDKSNNFTVSELSKISAYAKKYGKKIYLALNTLIKEGELEEIYNYLSEVDKMGIDAIIVQDIGVAWMIKQFFPNMIIHGSTQMGIHNSAGIEAAADMGLSRVILERQVTIKELDLIVQKSKLEVEVFAHGALCSSLSGNCLFSSSIGGWSGNRGRCKQPCRRRYHSKDGKNGFFFSPDDLYTLDLIPELIGAGVSSIKIEGRLKKADYVKRAVTAYRMVIDSSGDSKDSGKISPDIIGQAKMILSGSPGRKWSSGFYTEESMESLINYKSPGVSGMLSAEVTGSSPRGFTVKIARDLKKGDRIRIQPKSGDEGPQMTITAMNKDREKVNRSQKGDTIYIPFNQSVQKGSLVYKVGDTAQKSSKNIKNLPEYIDPHVLDLNIEISSEGFLISLPQYPSISQWNGKLKIESALKHGLKKETVEESFISTKEKMIKTGTISVSIEGQLFLPSSTLKKLRRDFWETINPQILELDKSNNKDDGIFNFMRVHSLSMGRNENSQPDKDVFITDPSAKKYNNTRKRSSKLDNAIHVMPLSSYNKNCSEILLPYFRNEFALDKLQSDIEKAYNTGIRRFRISSLFHISLLKKYKDIVISAAYPLPVSNSLAARQLEKMGIEKVQGWIEMEKEALINLVYFSPLPVEIYRYGRPHIFTSRADIEVEGEISDSHGVKFIVKKDSESGLNSLYGNKVFKIPNIDNTSGCFDYSNSEPGETATSDFNFSADWV